MKRSLKLSGFDGIGYDAARSFEMKALSQYMRSKRAAQKGSVLTAYIRQLENEFGINIRDWSKLLGIKEQILDKARRDASTLQIRVALDVFEKVSASHQNGAFNQLSGVHNDENVRPENEEKEEYIEARTQSDTGWVYLNEGRSLRILCDDVIYCIDNFIAEWQRSDKSGWDISDLQRDRIIQSCEALAGLLRNQMVERGLASGLRRRLNDFMTSAVVIAAIGGAAGGIAQSAAAPYFTTQQSSPVGISAEVLASKIERLLDSLPSGTCQGIEQHEGFQESRPIV